jgi:hypothetical protein
VAAPGAVRRVLSFGEYDPAIPTSHGVSMGLDNLIGSLS